MVNLFCSYDFGFVKAFSEKIFDTKTVRNQINDVVIDIAFNMIPKQSKVYVKIEFHMKVMVKNLLEYD